MPPAWKLSDEQIRDICERYQQGVSGIELASFHQVTGKTVYSALRNNGIRVRTGVEANGGLSERQLAEVARLYTNGESTYKIGRRYSLNPHTINGYLRKMNIPIRTRIEARRLRAEDQRRS